MRGLFLVEAVERIPPELEICLMCLAKGGYDLEGAERIFKRRYAESTARKYKYTYLYELRKKGLLDNQNRATDRLFSYVIDEIATYYSGYKKYNELIGKIKLLEPIDNLIDVMQKVSLNHRWAVAACYLTAMEIVINKKLKEMGIEVAEGLESRFRALLKALEDKGVKVGELERMLPKVFWNVRHKVVHAGYNPSRDELDIITKGTRSIILKLLQI